MKYSLAIPNFNRSDIVINSFLNVINDGRIDEVIINDDCSDDHIYLSLVQKLEEISNIKINLYKNKENIGAFKNKIKTVSLCKNDWVILLDSDNKIETDYLNIISNEEHKKDVIYAPDVAKCDSCFLNYKEFSNLIIEKSNLKKIIFENEKIMIVLNTGNYFFHKNEYLNTLNEQNMNFNPYACDVLYFNYLWLSEGKKIKVVKDLEYFHSLSNDSYYLKNSNVSQVVENDIKTNIINFW